MPSASAKLEKQISQDSNDPVKQVITVVEKKVRNLEKRKAKLDSYRSDSQKGKELNEDQKKAVEKYDQVIELLDLAKDLQKQFQTVIQDCTKAQKKAAKHEQLERQLQERQRIKEFLIYQDLLNSMGSEDVREDFLNGDKGAVKLTEEELTSIDELYKLICPERDPDTENLDFDNRLTFSAEHIQCLLDAKNKEVLGTTYKSLRDILQKIYNCSYFNKSDAEIANIDESIVNETEEKEESNLSEQYALQTEAYPCVEEFQVSQVNEIASGQSEASAPYYQIENSSLYTEQSHPIQEVLSVQGNLNFLQESQIEVESPHVEPQVSSSLASATYTNVEFPAATQSLPGNLIQQHHSRRASEETSAMGSHLANPNIVLANSVAIPQQQPNIPAPVALQPASQPIDFDPGRPIPTQTYTNQSFSSAIHPMMAVSPSYVPVTLSAHILPTNVVLPQPLPQRSSVTPTTLTNPNSLPLSAAHSSVSGLTTASALSQQANIYSLCFKMNQLSSENSQVAHISPPQYECNEIPESNMTKETSSSFGNGSDAPNIGETLSRAGSNPYARGPNTVEYRNDRAYQSTNNSQAYISRETFADSSSYSSNLKRGLTSRGGSRTAGAPKSASNQRGGRVGYRN